MSKQTDRDAAELENLRVKSELLFKQAADLAKQAKLIAEKVHALAAKNAKRKS